MTTPEPLTRGGTRADDHALGRRDFSALAYEGYDCLTVVDAPGCAEHLRRRRDHAHQRHAAADSDARPRPRRPLRRPRRHRPRSAPRRSRAPRSWRRRWPSARTRSAGRTARKRFGPTKREQSTARRWTAARARPASAGPRPATAASRPRQADRPRAQALRLRRQRRHGRLRRHLLGGTVVRRPPLRLRRHARGRRGPELHAGDLRRARRRRAARPTAVKGKTVTVAVNRPLHDRQGPPRASRAATRRRRRRSERQVFPSAGSRWEVPEIEAIEIWGSALISQTVTKTYLTLNRAGQFIRSSYSFGGTGPGAAVTRQLRHRAQGHQGHLRGAARGHDQADLRGRPHRGRLDVLLGRREGPRPEQGRPARDRGHLLRPPDD